MNTLFKISSPPIYCYPNTTILDAALLMKENRTNCLLIIDDNSGKLIGLSTTKDLAFKASLNNTLLISEIMSKNPYYVFHQTSVNDALNLMVAKKIRHLPIVHDDGTVIGVLNITTCFYNAMIRLERMSEKSKELEMTFNELNSDSTSSSRQNSISRQNSTTRNPSFSKTIKKITVKDCNGRVEQNNLDLVSLNEGLLDLNILKRKKKIINELKTLISLMKQPDLNSLLMDHELNVRKPFYIDTKTSIWDAAQLLVRNNITAALVVQNLDLNDSYDVSVDDVIGILTTKDLVFRVLSCQLDPKSSKVARIMTSKPEFASSSMAVHNALRLMYEGKYLNLPIKDSQNKVTGLVNVLDLTYSLLKLLSNTSLSEFDSDMQHSRIPAWNKFWDSLEKPILTVSKSLYPNESRVKSQRSSSFANLLTADTNKIASTENSYVDIQYPERILITPKPVSPLSTSTQNLIIKVKILENLQLGINGSIYKFEINDFDMNLIFKVQTKIQTKLPYKIDLQFQLGYIDTEGDYILIDSHEDLTLALKSQITNFLVKVHETKTTGLFSSLMNIMQPQIWKFIGGFTLVIFILERSQLLYSSKR